MCFDEDSHPPIPPIAGAAVDGKRITLRTADGTDFAAFAAQPAQPNGGGMIILPDVRGLFTFYEELALRFAEAGIGALAIDYFGRTAGTAPREAGFDYNPHLSQVMWQGLRADIVAARRLIGGWAGVRGVFSVGFCFGGRLSMLLASEDELAMAGDIGFYGWPTGEARGGVPAPIDRVSANASPILAIFGGADQGINAQVVESYRAALAGAGAPHEVITYKDAPHSFFDRKADEFAADSADAWKRALDFVRANTPAP
ncbi:MAG: dienelactone hydrolase family protein [Chloroflexota bacterium]|nr:dienelactone hydrolase family protein [Chloroflexota bacterium]